MSNINLSDIASGRDLNPKTPPMQQETFIDLYNEIIAKLDTLSTITDESSFLIELNKIRKKTKRLISKYFDLSLSKLSNIDEYQSTANHHKHKLSLIKKTFDF